METIGEYTQLEQIGKGSMGVVYRAYDPSLDRTVAIKMMSADLDAEPHLRGRFSREARIATRLDHPNIVKVHGLTEEDGRAYIVMEYLDGEDLTALINRGDAVSLERRLELMIVVTGALAYAHWNEVVHRDIKPSNIRITSDGQVKILDFGVAHIKDSLMTATGVQLGTPRYMSPEQVRGGKVDHRCDVYSAGAVFHELLTGEKAVAGSAVSEIFENIMGEEPTPIDELNPLLPERLSAIIRTTMAKAPGHRYQSMEDLLVELKRFGPALEKARAEARQLVQRGLRRLSQLREEHAQLLARPDAEDPVATEGSELPPRDDLPGEGDAGAETSLPDSYLELNDLLQRAAEAFAHTEALIGELQWVDQCAAEPLAEKSEKEIRRCANRVDEILDVYPGHPGARKLAGRLLAELKDRKAQARERRRRDARREARVSSSGP